MKRDPELIAIVGVLCVALVGLVGYFLLAWQGVELPTEVLALVSTAVGGVLGWATRAIAGEPDSEKVPAAPVQSHVDVPIIARADDYAYRDDPSQRA